MAEFQFARYPSLAGRSVLVSGGATGIGEAIVRAFAAQGAKVGFIDMLEREGTELAAELAGQGASIRFTPVDVTDIAALQAAIGQMAAALGPITVLVNNAANDDRHDWQGETPESFDKRLAVNLKHQFFAIQAIAPGMIAAGGGSIINFSSIAWRISMGNLVGYTTAKAGVEGLTRSFARDLGKHRIRVNAVLPGWIMTERQLRLWVDENTDKIIAERQCLPDRIQPAAVARMVLFLAADDSADCSAQNFVVDAGWL